MRFPKSTEKSMGRGARAAAAQSRWGRASRASVSPGRTIRSAPAVGG
ncbi:OTOP3 isoform 1 [Pan troglodytes]|uniref:OTOP3 isoform 1 n=2 Tax=Hominidae TaxID=9604 RepID=A0A2J8Y0E1_PONAB|nr:OTOP3 isoform 1 [Pan troglodytes]PNJ87713.1 OTOP3 isoform 1 [Pongo abelii]